MICEAGSVVGQGADFAVAVCQSFSANARGDHGNA
jgi:hypothetical protein